MTSINAFLLTFLLVISVDELLTAQNIYPWPESGNIEINVGSYPVVNKLHIGPNGQGWNGNDLVVSNTTGSLAIHNETGQTYLFGSSNLMMSLFLNPWGGNVGIGTKDTKGYKLAVAGTTVMEEVVVKLKSTWPDYVFNGDYKLPVLSDLEEFIRTQEHLPDVRTAADVKQNGVSLGEMNASLLKKIEELALHFIAQDKRIEEL